jgi:glutamate--cysteine ligase
VPSRVPTLTRDEAHRAVATLGFGEPSSTRRSPSRRVGIELEWLAVDAADPSRPVPLEVIDAAAAESGPLPGASLLTFEPGGQVELSTPPHPLTNACDTAAEDARLLGEALARSGVALVALGLEPGPRRRRVLHNPRYDAMEAYFDRSNDAGRAMMRSTAALQVNLDLGERELVESRWRAAHALGPVLAATFANSPIGVDGPTGFKSTRLAVWGEIDPTRTSPPPPRAECGDAWADYALAAPVMQVRLSPERHVPILTGLRFDDWIARGHDLGYPTIEDLEYHLTTLFPPVRPRGWLELRMLDALPDPWWRAAVAASTVLVDTPGLIDEVATAIAPTRDRWREAARDGLSDPALGTAARACFAVVLEALTDANADATTIETTAAFADQYVMRGRCLADDRVDAWTEGRALLPRPDNARALGLDRTPIEAAWI